MPDESRRKHIHDGGVYFRTSEDGMIARSQLTQATFQLDHIDLAARSGWTVLVNGPANRITDPALLKHSGAAVRTSPGRRANATSSSASAREKSAAGDSSPCIRAPITQLAGATVRLGVKHGMSSYYRAVGPGHRPN
ncbi:pyridoxamine 5'-phosphate oxidase family protein [Arthrobacter sp. Hz1]